MFTELYLQTTNPKLTFYQLMTPPILTNIIISIIFHLIIYQSFANLVSFIFTNKILSKFVNYKLFISLIVIMGVGFIFRFLHVKEIYKTYNNDLNKTRNHLDKLYITWIFIS